MAVVYAGSIPGEVVDSKRKNERPRIQRQPKQATFSGAIE
jgi:hypothetical protein